MDRQAYLDLAGVSGADWEEIPTSVKRLVEVLIERLEHQDQQIQKMQADIEWLKEKHNRPWIFVEILFAIHLGSDLLSL
jgi:hypothetical protein